MINFQLNSPGPIRTIGIMSGTSMDGLDICVADIDLNDKGLSFEIIKNQMIPFPVKLKEKIKNCLWGTTADVARLNYEFGEWSAKTIRKFLKKTRIKGVELVGFHGQTIYHSNKSATLQIGEPSFITKETGLPIVYDFRANDIIYGGTGAPLMPKVDEWLFRNEKTSVIILNLGGIANITHLPPLSSGIVLGFDTGPGMGLLDEYYQSHFKTEFDQNGKLATQGKPNKILVPKWLKDEFIRRIPPKSTGRHRYGKEWINNHSRDFEFLADNDALATLAYFTAASIFQGTQYIKDEIDSVITSGGGSHNLAVMRFLKECFHPIPVRLSSDFGIDVDFKEALGFAILGVARVKNLPANIPSVTGATKACVLGKLVWVEK